MLKPQTPELLPSDNDELMGALLAEGITIENVERIIEVKKMLESIPRHVRMTGGRA